MELDPILEGEYCMPGEIEIDNDSSPEYTKLTIEVKDYPGLLRVITWVINGLDLLVETAKLTTEDDGMAKNVFWITDRRGNKLSNFHARMLQERVGDFVVYCTPDNKTLSAHKFESGAITVDNEEDEKFTVVTIAEGKERVTALLDVASAMTGIGVIIHEAIIQGDKEQADQLLGDTKRGRATSGVRFKFWVSDRQKHKLDYARATALLFTLNLVFGNNSDARLRSPMPQHAVT
ncbi:g10506 [Coccomyxa elongata]